MGEGEGGRDGERRSPSFRSLPWRATDGLGPRPGHPQSTKSRSPSLAHIGDGKHRPALPSWRQDRERQAFEGKGKTKAWRCTKTVQTAKSRRHAPQPLRETSGHRLFGQRPRVLGIAPPSASAWMPDLLSHPPCSVSCLPVCCRSNMPLPALAPATPLPHHVDPFPFQR